MEDTKEEEEVSNKIRNMHSQRAVSIITMDSLSSALVISLLNFEFY